MQHQEQRKAELQKIVQELQKQIEEEKERSLARKALFGEGCADIAELIGYNEGGVLHKRIDWRLNLIISRHKRRYPKEKLIIAINGFRGFGKSTIYQRCNLIKRCIKEPMKSRLLVSSKKDLAADMLSPIKRIFESNINIRKYYPNMVGTQKWTNDEILVAPAEQMQNPDNNYTIETWGVDANIASKRYDEIFVDDIVGKDNVINSKFLDAASKGFKLLLPLLKPGGIMFILFMRWGQKDWYDENVISAFAPLKHFHHIIVPDVECDHDGNPVNKHGERVDEDSPERIPTFPEKYPLSYLDTERIMLGEMYWSHYRQYPRRGEGKLLDYTKLRHIPDEEYANLVERIRLRKIDRDELVLFVDNANTFSDQSNPWAFTLWRYNDATLDLVYFRKAKFLLDDAITELIKLIQYYGLDTIYAEKSGLEGNLQYGLRKKLNAYGVTNVNFEGVSHEGKNKKLRILAIQPFLNIGAVRIPPASQCYHPFTKDGPPVSQLKLLREEMELFPDDATHIPDDLIDAFGFVPKLFNIDMEYTDLEALELHPTTREAQIQAEEDEKRMQTRAESDNFDEETGEEIQFL